MDEAKEQARARYKPSRVRLLLMAEAPPERNFFYYGKGPLFTAIRAALAPRFRLADKHPKAFLTKFRDCGGYLVDLSLDSIPRDTPDDERAAIREGALPGLTNCLRTLNRPEAVMACLTGIDEYVRRAVRDQTWAGIEYEARPFPLGRGYPQFVTGLAALAERIHFCEP